MSTTTGTQRIRTEFWSDTVGDADYEGVTAFVEVEREDDEPRVALRTFVDGRGSVTSYYLSRDDAVALARDLLSASLP